MRGLTGTRAQRQDYNWATVLENAGVSNEPLRNIAGFALTAAFDPLNLLAVGPGARLARGAWQGLSRGAQATPILGRAIDAFAPHVGRVPLTVLRREVGDATANQLMDEARRWRNLESGGAVKSALRETADVFRAIPEAERIAAFRTMVEHHGTPWEHTLRLARTDHQRKVIHTFERLFDHDTGTVAAVKAGILDVAPVEGTYARVLYADPTDAAVYHRTVTQLRRQDATTTARLRRERGFEDTLADPTLVDDAALVAIYDIAETKLLAQRARLVSGEFLQSMGFRKRATDEVVSQGEMIFRPNGSRIRTLLTEKGDEIAKLKLPEEEWIGPASIVRALDSLMDPITQNALLSIVDQINALWKPLVTSIFPAFHARNIYSNVVLNAHSGLLNPLWYAKAARLQKMGSGEVVVPLRDGGDFRLPLANFLDEVEQLEGINAGTRWFRTAQETGEGRLERLRAWVFGEEVPVKLQGRARAIEQVGRAFERYFDGLPQRNTVNPFRWGHTLNEAGDNNAKLAHILWRISQGEPLDRAVALSREALPDYVEFATSPTFRAVRGLIPFASWLRFNAPRQLQLLIEQPYVLSQMSHAVTGVETLAESLDADEQMLPEWILERFNILLGREDDGALRVVYGLGLPIEDLNFWFSSFQGRGAEPGLEGAAAAAGGTIKNVLDDLGPVPKVMIELATERSLFTGERIDDPDLANYYRRAWRWTEHVPGLRDWLEIEPRTTSTGRELWVGNPLKLYMFSIMLGRAAREVDKGLEFVDERDGLVALSLLSGVKVSDRVFPRAPSDEPISAQLADDPALRTAYEAYTAIPVFPQFGDPVASRRADKALGDIADRQRWLQSMRPDLPDAYAWEVAAAEWGTQDAAGELLARQVRYNNWKRDRKARSAYLDTHPELRAAFDRLTPGTRQRLLAAV